MVHPWCLRFEVTLTQHSRMSSTLEVEGGNRSHWCCKVLWDVSQVTLRHITSRWHHTLKKQCEQSAFHLHFVYTTLSQVSFVSRNSHGWESTFSQADCLTVDGWQPHLWFFVLRCMRACVLVCLGGTCCWMICRQRFSNHPEALDSTLILAEIMVSPTNEVGIFLPLLRTNSCLSCWRLLFPMTHIGRPHRSIIKCA